VAEALLAGVGSMALVFINKIKLPSPFAFLSKKAVEAAIAVAIDLSVDQVRKLHEDAIAKQDYLAAVLTGFELALKNGEENKERPILLRQP